MTYQLIVNGAADVKKLKKLYESGKNLCIFLHSNNCGPCKMFSPVWDNVLHQRSEKKLHDMLFIKIEVNNLQMIHEMSEEFYNNVIMKMLNYLNAVPNVGKYNPKTKRVYVMKRNRESNLKRFIR